MIITYTLVDVDDDPQYISEGYPSLCVDGLREFLVLPKKLPEKLEFKINPYGIGELKDNTMLVEPAIVLMGDKYQMKTIIIDDVVHFNHDLYVAAKAIADKYKVTSLYVTVYY